MQQDIAEILIAPEQIERRVAEMGATLAARYGAGPPPLVIAIMQGCVVFLADLLRELPIQVDLEFVYCRSYRGAQSGAMEFAQRSTLPATVRGRRVLLVDDIFDTGRTMAQAVAQLGRLQAAEVTAAVLLAKRGQALPGALRPDLVGFEIENRFVVGYGLDYNGRYRNLPYIGVLRQEALDRLAEGSRG